MISRSCTYGLRAMLHLASVRADGYTPTREISRRLGFSPTFLAKVLQPLIAAGLVRSQRGPRGGVALAKPPESITIEHVIAVLDGPELFEACVLGLPACGTEKPCPLHHRWPALRTSIHGVMTGTTLADMLRQSNTSRSNLT